MVDQAKAARLKRAREGAGFRSGEAAANEFGWVRPTYRAHESGTRGIPADAAKKYAAAFNVAFEWLMYGKGPMGQLDTAPHKTQPRATAGISGGNATRPVEESPFSKGQLPIYGTVKGAPDGALILDQHIYEIVPCPTALRDVEGAYGVYVVGDSMEDRYRAGEMVFVNPNIPPRRGDYVVVQVRKSPDELVGYIKRFVSSDGKTVVVEQLNPPLRMSWTREEVEAVHVIRAMHTP